MRSMRDYYRAKFKGELFVIKAGGRVISDDKARRSLLSNIQDLTASGIQVLLIYGGGHMIDEALKTAGIEPVKRDGRRITTGDVIPHVKNVMAADLSYKIGATMNAVGLHGLCLSTLPPAWIKLLMRESEPDMKRFDATIQEVYGDQIGRLFKAIPFVACPCISVTDEDGVNINADDVAVAIASGTQARKLIFLSDVDGVLIDGSNTTFLTDADIPGLIKDGTVSGGMKVKLENCMRALHNGVRRIHLVNGFHENALALEIDDSEPIGISTMLIREEDRGGYLNELAAQKVFEGSH